MPDLNSLPPSTRSPPPTTASATAPTRAPTRAPAPTPASTSTSTTTPHTPVPVAFPPTLSSVPLSLSLSSSTSQSSSSTPPRFNTFGMSSTTTNNNGNNTTANNDGSEPPTSPSASRPSPSPSRSASTSLQAAAAVNAGLQHEGSRRSSNSLSRQVTTSSSNSRRRSQVHMNLHLNDPSVPGPGEMVHERRGSGSMTSPIAVSSTSPLMLAAGGDPHHNRAPSLGSLHQDMEAEQEAHVNRLLHQIRQQQTQILQLQGQSHSQSAVAGEDSPGQATLASVPQPIPTAPGAHHASAVPVPPSSGSLPRSPVFPRGSFGGDLRHRSRTPSRGASPRLRSTSISQDSAEPFSLSGRDDSAFYQAETQMLTRENQMLRNRIRELERQLETLNGGTAAITREPPHHSGLARSESVSEEARPSAPGTTPGSEVTLPIREQPKEE